MIPYEELISGRAQTFFSKASPMAVKANGRFITEIRTLSQTAKRTQRARFDNAIFKADGRVAKANGRFLKDCYFYARLRRRPEKPIRASILRRASNLSTAGRPSAAGLARPIPVLSSAIVSRKWNRNPRFCRG